MPKRSAQDARDTGALSRDERKNQHIMKLFEREKKLEQRREDKKKHAVSPYLPLPLLSSAIASAAKTRFRIAESSSKFKSTERVKKVVSTFQC